MSIVAGLLVHESSGAVSLPALKKKNPYWYLLEIYNRNCFRHTSAIGWILIRI